jgi:hypothetical protein
VFLWRTESSAHTVHSPRRLLPSAVPSFSHLSHRPTRQLRVTPFTRHGEQARHVAEQWTAMWRSWGSLGTTTPQPVRYRWTTSCTGCGWLPRPQPVEIRRPRFHSPLSWPDAFSPAGLWTTFGTTSQSPGCGRKKVGKSVEDARNQAGIRTAGGAASRRRSVDAPHQGLGAVPISAPPRGRDKPPPPRSGPPPEPPQDAKRRPRDLSQGRPERRSTSRS